ncbi:signal peptidase I, partial [Candidatus Daviesbacteria bacterium]|nr:signal peptidase I [Candidatus Daviesbacteria bacterium]
MSKLSKTSLRTKTFGSSMLPFFKDGDIVQIKRIAFSKIKVNDFITFKKNNLFVTHRVIYIPAKNTNYLITKGDNNPYSDGKIFPKDILGKVEKIERDNQIIDPESTYLFQSTLYFSQIQKVIKALNLKNIEYLILKGLPLHLYFEKIHPRRFYLDCDILISKKDLLAVKKIFDKLGYSLYDNSLSETHRKLKDKNPELTFTKLVNNFNIN